MVHAISRCNSGFVLIITVCKRSNCHPGCSIDDLRLLRANQRKFCICSENVGGQSRSAWNLSTSRPPLILLKSHWIGVCCACSSTTTQARCKTPQVSRSGTRKRDG